MNNVDPGAALVGGVVLLAVWPFLCAWIMRRFASWGAVRAPEGMKNDDWQAILRGGGGAKLGALIGTLETLLVYFAVLVSLANAPLVVGGWLAFKVASKWENWANIVRVPDQFEGVSKMESLRARRHWGELVYVRFLVGTLLNILAGGGTALLVLQA